MVRFTFTKNERIRKRKEFDKIFLQGDRYHNSYFHIIVNKNNLTYRRIGIIVKKSYGDAHLRNKIKRQIREIYRLNKEKFPQKADCIIIIKEKAKNLSYREIQSSLFMLLERGERSSINSDIKN